MLEVSLKKELDSYISNYLRAKNALDVASDRYLGLDKSDYYELGVEGINSLRNEYDRALREFDSFSSCLASFVAAHKDHISIDE